MIEICMYVLLLMLFIKPKSTVFSHVHYLIRRKICSRFKEKSTNYSFHCCLTLKNVELLSTYLSLIFFVLLISHFY